MLDETFILIFFNFYFNDIHSLVNLTDCIQICNEREMTLPHAKDNKLILEQFESKFGNEIFELSNDMDDSKSDRESGKKKQFLTYFIGGSYYISYKNTIFWSDVAYETFKMHGMISKKINGLQRMSKLIILNGKMCPGPNISVKNNSKISTTCT